jgi:hypothetical protein
MHIHILSTNFNKDLLCFKIKISTRGSGPYRKAVH